MATDFELTVLKELGDIKALCADNKAKHEANADKIAGIEKTNTRQWWFHIMSPLFTLAYAIARKSGVNI